MAVFLLASCGGGGHSNITVSGVVQKGLFDTLAVTAYKIDPATALKGDPLAATITDQQFSVDVPKNSLVLIEATGTFANEITGTPVLLDAPLQTLINTTTQSQTSNINLVTTLSAQRSLEQMLASGLSMTELINANDAFIAAALNLPLGTDLTALDYGLISSTSTLSDPNLQLLLFSGAVMSDLTGNALFSGGLDALANEFTQAQSIADLQPALSQFTGSSTGILYDTIQISGAAGDLPALDLAGNSVWSCDQGICGWVPAAASPTIYVGSDVLYEAEGVAHVAVRLGQTGPDPVEVRVFTESGSAAENLDFVPQNLTVTIPAGEFTAGVDIQIPIDALSEGDESFFVHIGSDAPGYVIDNDTGTVMIRDGAPPLSDPVPDQLEILNVCVNGIGAPGTVSGTGCTQTLPNVSPLNTGNADAAAVEIDLAATCATASNCAPIERNWLVNFFVVAKDASGVQRDERALGPYVYGRESVQLTSAAENPRNLLISFHSADIIDILQVALDNSWQLEIEARIGPQDQLVAAFPLPGLVPVPGSVLAGDILVPIGAVQSAVPGDGTNCAIGELEVTADFEMAGSSAANGTACIAPGTPTDAAFTGTLTSGEIDLALALVPVASDHTSVLVTSDGLSQSAGVNAAFVLPAAVNGIPLPARSFLHAEGWPFMFRISGGTLSADGIELTYDGMRYVMDVGYSDQDPRAHGQLRSNDIWYGGVKGRSGTMSVNAEGRISTSFTVLDGDEYTAFPKARVRWRAFPQTLENSVIVNQPTIVLDEFTLTQDASCRSEACIGGTQIAYSVSTDSAQLDPRGFVLGPAQTIQGSVPGWGAQPTGNLAWQRPNDIPAAGAALNLALPGYRLPADGSPQDYLLAHVGYADTGHALYPLGSLDNDDGNYYPTGVSFGPEIYRDDAGIPSIGRGQDPSGKNLLIDNQVDTLSIATSVAAKYVIRNGGITGVFNADPDALRNALGFYGYALALDRFAVRVVDNQLDTYNWVDGSLTLNGDLGGPDGLKLFFSNLEINCGARLGNANLTYENCDSRDNNDNGVIDENCGHRMYAWSADTDIFSMTFDSASACAVGNQLLTLQQQVSFMAVDGPVGLEGSWDDTGALVGQQTGLQHAYRLDKRETGEGAGFPIKSDAAMFAVDTVSGSATGRYGWLEMTASKVGVPFWNAIDSDIRVANRLSIGQPTAEPTVLAARGVLEAERAAQNQLNGDLQQQFIDHDPPINARYEWGNTGFGFSLPVYFSPWQFNSDQSQFLGIRKEIDLFVLDAGAGIDFIDPVRTKLSFGASADFEKLKSVKFQIDLGNPESLRKVDSLLVKLHIVNHPVIEPALSDLQDNIFILNRYANKGLDEVMQEGLETGLQELGEAAAQITPNGEDPFVTTSKAMAKLKSYPEQVFAILDEGIKAPIDNLLLNQEDALRAELIALENQVEQLQVGDPVPAEAFDALDAVQFRLDTIADSATQVAFTVQDSIDDVQALIQSMSQPVSDIEDATAAIDQLLIQAVIFTESACTDDDISGAESAGYLDQIIIRIASVRRIFDLLESDDLLIPLTELLNNDPELRQRIDDARRDIRAKAQELTGFLNDADAALRSQVCNPRIDTLLADVKAIVSQIRNDARTINGLLTAAGGQVARLDERADGLYEGLILPIQQLDNTLQSLRLILEAQRAALVFESSDGQQTGGPALIRMLDARIAEITDNRITAIVADPAQGETDILDVAFGAVQGLLDVEYQSVRDEIKAMVDDRLPGAYFTPEELRRTLVTAIMGSPPVEDLRIEMNQHFSEINYRVNNLVLQLLDQLNLGIRGALAGVESKVNDALDKALAPVRNIPLKSAGIDGFGVIAGNELERAHVGAEWTMSPAADGQEPNTFGAALDVVSWSSNNKAAGCGVGENEGRLDVSISALGLPATIAGSKITLKKVILAFNLANNPGGSPPLGVRGVYGGLTVTGDIGFAEAIVYDPAFFAGIGDIETYIGASAGALFSDIQAEVAFLVGRTCNDEILLELDPKVAKFITLPPSGFAGAYLRGAASIPLLTLGCPLVLGVGAEFGSWVLAGPPLTVGGLVGGAAYGKVACAGALRGQIRALGQVNADGEWSFAGEGFGAAGVGWCEPAAWTTVERSREDDFCATGDAQFKASFDGKWHIPSPKIDAVF